MNTTSLLTLVLLAIASQAFAQTITVDNFDDGNDDGWGHVDFTEGEPWGPGIYSIADGEYTLETSGPVPFEEDGVVASRWEKSSEPQFSNGFLRVRINAGEEETYAAVMMRVSESDEGFGGYWFGGDAGRGGFKINRTIADIGRDFPSGKGKLDTDAFPFLANEDWMIEAGAVGDQISLKVWRPEEPEPEHPQVTVTDTMYSEGFFGVVTNTTLQGFRSVEPQIFTTFDDITFTFPVDCNGDGVVDIADTLCATPESLGNILSEAKLIQGDADGNGQVEFADFLVLSANFGQDGDYQQGNFDLLDGIDFSDFLILSSNFGIASGAVAAVPEPGGWVLMLLGIPLLIRKKIR